MLPRHEIELAADAMVAAAEATAAELGEGDVAGEEDFTGQMIGGIKANIRNLKSDGVRWETAASVTEADDSPDRPKVRVRARQLTSKGEGSEESWAGADLVMALEIKTPDYEVRKGFLAQAKLLKPGRLMRKEDFERLKGQCDDMLSLSAASFVILYSDEGVTVLPATVVQATSNRRLHELETWGPKVLFLDFLICWIGDPWLRATDRASLAELRALARARNAVLIRATVEGERRGRRIDID